MTAAKEYALHCSKIIIGERVVIVALVIALIAMISYRENRKSAKWLLLAIVMNIIQLIGDSEAYSYASGADMPIGLAWFFYFIAYIFGYAIMIPFSMYVKSYIEEKTTVNKWLFRIPVIAEIIAISITVISIAQGTVYGNVDGKIEDVGGAPTIATFLSIIVIIYVFIAAMTKVKQIGLKASMLLGLFGLVPTAVIIINYDYATMCGGMAVLVVFVLLQGDTSAEKEKQKQQLSDLNEKLAESNEEQKAQLEEIAALNQQLEENQSELEALSAEQEAQLEEIQELMKKNEYMYHSCKQVYSEVYMVDLANDTYEEITIDDSTDGESGCYSRAIEDHIATLRIHDNEKSETYDFLSIPNLLAKLSEKRTIEKRYLRTLRDGSTQWCLTSFAICEEKDGKPTVVLMLIKNIDEVIKEEERQNALLAEAVENAKNANRAKSDFLSRMSHDIRTPMNVIVGMTEIAKRHFGEQDRVMDCLDKINMESVHLQTLINDVLDISAIESGKLTVHIEEVRMKDIIENMNISMASLVQTKSIDFVYEEGNIFFPYINTDNMRVCQVYLNLLSNAVKYTPAGGRVKFEVWQTLTDDTSIVNLHARISDTGMGMSEEFMQNMYNEFIRAVDSRVNKIQGTGLGLAIVKQITDMMNGVIEVQSELNKGTIFHVSLPVGVVEKTDARKEMIDDDFDYDKLNGLNVLVAEDNDFNYEIAEDLLSDYGMTVTRAEDGLIALDIMDNSEPGAFDFILMDMQMPVMDGLEATREIRKLNREDAKKIPIIAMTANAFAEDALACREAGMDSHVAKPIKIKFLLETILTILAEKQ